MTGRIDPRTPTCPVVPRAPDEVLNTAGKQRIMLWPTRQPVIPPHDPEGIDR